ncbi:MAG: 23S rRNA (adenine(2503)-C(2))-methyltransferase RlmN [Gammaproteobacteria bacterium]|nr:23S rRNA (adenine(2503)-C(2))-methyltransferase RlmN [Gammaproteobacteria bacterium]
MQPVNFFNLTHEALRSFFTDMGEKPYRATQVMKWVYHHGVIDLELMTDLSKDLRQRLEGLLVFDLLKIETEKISNDGTRKWLMRVDEKNCIESVFIPETDRGTLCVSSQVGCPLDCSFCSTGKQGFSRNLSMADIIGQVWLANRELGYFGQRNRIITNVVMMGMGEPLLNFENVTAAMDLMKDDLGFGLSTKRVTLSTAGVVPGIDRLAQTTRVSLAVSLHAPNNPLRDTLVPLNRSYPIKALLEACHRYSETNQGDPITFEYVMLANINDSAAHAHELGRLLRGFPAKINLIPFNPFPGSGYTCSSKPDLDRFREILMEYELITITRKTRGDDIDAACGQLVGQVVAKAKRNQMKTEMEIH